MSQLEIVHLRPADGGSDTLVELIRRAAGTGDASAAVTVYRRAGVAVDIAVHILSVGAGQMPTAAGLRIASELRRFGMVQHSIWEEAAGPD